MSYVISLGLEPVAVPDLGGASAEEAQAALDDAGLAGAPSEAYSDTVAAGLVSGQDPAAGQSVTPGSTVSYVISLGLEPVAVPDLGGASAEEAQAALDDAGLAGAPSEAYSDTVAAGLVSGQDPAAGQSVTPGSTVSYVISLGLEPVAVPDLGGASAEEAQAALDDAGLAGAPSEAYSDTVAAGLVSGQDPAAGQSVTPGSTVSYVISLGLEPVAVPDLGGASAEEAQAALDDAGLAGAPSEAYSDTVAAGLVSGQDPAAGQSVTPGSTVSYVISLGLEPVAVPDLGGASAEEAQAALDDAGLAGAPSEAYSDTVAAGLVSGQDPAAGQSVTPGSTVSYVISLGLEPVAVPDLGGASAEEAQAALDDAGLAGAPSEAYSDTVAAGLVSGQDPRPARASRPARP